MKVNPLDVGRLTRRVQTGKKTGSDENLLRKTMFLLVDIMSAITYIARMSQTSPNSESALSFREKSAWASLAVMMLVFVPYFVRIFQLFRWRELTAAAALGQFIGAVIFQVVLLVFVYIVIALRSRHE